VALDPALRLPFLWTSSGSGAGEVRRPGDDLRHAATSLIALIIAVPISFGIAVFLTELSPKWLKRPLGTAIELLAAIPSIVYGCGLLVFSPLLATYVQQRCSGFGDCRVGALFSARPSASASSRRHHLAIMIIPSSRRDA